MAIRGLLERLDTLLGLHKLILSNTSANKLKVCDDSRVSIFDAHKEQKPSLSSPVRLLTTEQTSRHRILQLPSRQIHETVPPLVERRFSNSSNQTPTRPYIIARNPPMIIHKN